MKEREREEDRKRGRGREEGGRGERKEEEKRKKREGRKDGEGEKGAGGERKKEDNFFFQAEDGIRDDLVTGVQTCALPILKNLFQVCENFRMI